MAKGRGASLHPITLHRKQKSLRCTHQAASRLLVLSSWREATRCVLPVLQPTQQRTEGRDAAPADPCLPAFKLGMHMRSQAAKPRCKRIAEHDPATHTSVAKICSGLHTPCAMKARARASAIWPAPMNPMRLSMATAGGWRN